MSDFEVKIVKVDDVVDHLNADRLTIVSIGGYRCIANKRNDGSWRYATGDLVAYIAEGSLVPEWLLRRLGMWNEEKGIGFLAGAKGDRVKAIKLRGIISQGVLLPVHSTNEKDYIVDEFGNELTVNIGEDIQDLIGITKYDPPIPEGMAGEVVAIHNLFFKYDIENWKKHPEILQKSEEVIFTEKLHGTFMGIGYIPGLAHDEMLGGGDFVTFSKGLGNRGLFFKSAQTGNVYVNMFKQLVTNINLVEKMKAVDEQNLSLPMFILGEIFGAGVQDLHYGMENGKKDFRAFDIYIGYPGQGFYLNADSKKDLLAKMGVQQVPILWQGPWDQQMAENYCKGRDTLSNSHVREGIVINTAIERDDETISRVQLKYINPKYLLRKNATEFN